jgi:MinD superfamily P-loop ATPase
MNIAIASGKGGTGKTTVSVNLTSYLCQTRPAVLVDLDVEEPNAGLFLETEVVSKTITYKQIPVWNQASCTSCGLCARVCEFNAVIQIKDDILIFPELCHSCGACVGLCPANALVMESKEMGIITHSRNDNLEFVESRLNPGEEQAVPQIRETKSYIASNFNDSMLCIMDAPPGTSCPVVEVIRDADVVLFVAEPTPFGLHDLQLAVKAARSLGKEPAVIINRVGIGNEDTEKFCREQSLRVIARIPNDRDIARSYSDGKLLFQEFSSVRSAMEAVKKFLDEAEQQFSANQATANQATANQPKDK